MFLLRRLLRKVEKNETGEITLIVLTGGPGFTTVTSEVDFSPRLALV